MGNRAAITASTNANPDSPALYLHWNGGVESVLAFLHAAEDLGFRDPTKDPSYGLGYLQALTAMFFGSGSSTGLGTVGSVDADNGDNGLYIIGPKFTIADRLYAPEGDSAKTFDELSMAQREKYHHIREQLRVMWTAAQGAGKAFNESKALASKITPQS